LYHLKKSLKKKPLHSTSNRRTEKPVIKKTVSKVRIGFSSEDDLLEVIESEEQKKSEKPKVLNLEIINQIWDGYIKEVNSPSLKASLKVKDFEIEEKKIIIHLPSASVLNTVAQEEGLLNKIRDSFAIDELEITPLLNHDKFPEHKKYTPKKKLSNREKYELLNDVNPLLQQFKNKFNLKVDSE